MSRDYQYKFSRTEKGFTKEQREYLSQYEDTISSPENVVDRQDYVYIYAEFLRHGKLFFPPKPEVARSIYKDNLEHLESVKAYAEMLLNGEGGDASREGAVDILNQYYSEQKLPENEVSQKIDEFFTEIIEKQERLMRFIREPLRIIPPAKSSVSAFNNTTPKVAELQVDSTFVQDSSTSTKETGPSWEQKAAAEKALKEGGFKRSN